MKQKLNKERWKPVVGFEKFYEVSDQGRVRSLHFSKSKILTFCAHSNGYVRVSISDKTKIVNKYVHRLVLEAFVGPANGLECDHIDCDKTNNNLSNLEWVTRTEQVRRQVKTGHHNKVKLSPDMVRKIRAMYETKMPMKIIANYLGIGKSTISSVLSKQTWSYV